MLSVVPSRAEVSRDPAQRIFALQRDVLLRARAVSFTNLAGLGGIPTWREECVADGRDVPVSEGRSSPAAEPVDNAGMGAA